MLRISQYLRALAGQAPAPRSAPPGSTRPPVVIWNVLRRCNLTCRHCYATSADTDFKGELDTRKALRVIDDLHATGVRVLVLSGGEPLMRPDIFTLAGHARSLGFYVALSTNGTLIGQDNIEAIAATGFDYVGISIDGLADLHDAFRRMQGAFERSMAAARLCREHGIRVGLRTTLTQHNSHQLPTLLDLMRTHDIQKYYLSHMNYSGRGRARSTRGADADHAMTRHAMRLIFSRAWEDIEAGRDTEFVSGNNDADAVLLLQWAREHIPQSADSLETMLRVWGGNDGRWVLAGNTLPAGLVVLDADDLSLVQRIDTATEAHPESSRVSAVYTAPPRKSFIVALKDVPEAWEIPYGSDRPDFKPRRLSTDNLLDDFSFSPDYRQLIASSRQAKGMEVIDLDSGKLIKRIPLPGMPHLGSGIFWKRGGRLIFATPNISTGLISVLDAQTWEPIREIKTLGPGFFMRSHANSPYAWTDVFFGPDNDAVHVIDKQSLEIVRTLRPMPGKNAAHVEFTHDGRHLLLSVWDTKGALIVYDSKTLQEIKRIPMNKPSGKYNVGNKIEFAEGASH
ncbi:PqqA peptide cyclase [Castellaniella denitrificans]